MTTERNRLLPLGPPSSRLASGCRRTRFRPTCPAVNPDAFGNPLASTQTGEWAGGLGGNRGLTSKELDTAAGLYYFYQRWYDPQTATFASRAPYPPMINRGLR